jgi:hypothetical protein
MAEPVVLRFHRSLYEGEAVRAAAARFGHLAAIEVEDVEADVKVTLRDVPERLRGRIGDELGNHALFETIVRRRTA